MFENRMEWLKSICPLVDEYNKYGVTWETMSGRTPYGATCLWCLKDSLEIMPNNTYFCQNCYTFGDIFSLAHKCEGLCPRDFMKKKLQELNIEVPKEIIEREKSESDKRYKARLDDAKRLRNALSQDVEYSTINHKLAHPSGARLCLAEDCDTYQEFLDAIIEIVKANICRLESKPEEDPWG